MGIVTYNKLVRDKIPEIIRETGKVAVVETLSHDEYKKSLHNKLGEELKEYLSSNSIEELADLVEVIYAILKCTGIDISEFEDIRRKKVNDRGAFEKRLLLKEVIEK